MLGNRGVDVVGADLDNVESLVHAFENANVIFAVTKMYAGRVDQEVAQGKHVADAASGTKTLEHLIWSTLPSASTVSAGRWPVPHMDGKAEVDDYIINCLPALARKTTFFWGGFYAENVLYPNFSPNLLATAEKHVWVQPVDQHTPIPMVGDHNINVGIFVERVFSRPEICLPMKYVLGVTEWITNGELLNLWTKIVGEVQDKAMDTVYIKSDLDTVDLLWPEMGREHGLLLKVLEKMGKDAWTKKGVDLITSQDLGLEVGKSRSGLVSLELTFKKMSLNLESCKDWPRE